MVDLTGVKGRFKRVSSFHTRVLALLILLALILPTMSRAEESGSLSVEILSVEQTVRGSEISLRAVATGDKTNVNLKWHLPEGFELIEGQIEQKCEELNCEIEIKVLVTEGSSLGPLTIGVEAKYV